MFNKVSKFERQIRNLEKEIALHQKKINASKRADDQTIHRLRLEGALKELQKAKANLIVAKAEKARKEKNK